MWIAPVVRGLMIAIPLYLAIRFLRVCERRTRSVHEIPSPASVIEALEDEVATLRANVAQLMDAQDFTTDLRRERHALAAETTRVFRGGADPPLSNTATSPIDTR